MPGMESFETGSARDESRWTFVGHYEIVVVVVVANVIHAPALQELYN
jgi:hypothetical protein